MTTEPLQVKPTVAGMLVCPYLGIREDDRTCLGYPSIWNLCHHCKPVMAVRLSHQRQACLAPGHTECPVFQSQDPMPLPASLRGDP